MFPKHGSWALGSMNNWSAGGETKELWMGGWLGEKEPRKEIALALFPGFCLFSSGISSVYGAAPSDLVSICQFLACSRSSSYQALSVNHTLFTCCQAHDSQAWCAMHSEWGRRVGHDWETQQQQQQQPHELEGKN